MEHISYKNLLLYKIGMMYIERMHENVLCIVKGACKKTINFEKMV